MKLPLRGAQPELVEQSSTPTTPVRQASLQAGIAPIEQPQQVTHRFTVRLDDPLHQMGRR